MIVIIALVLAAFVGVTVVGISFVPGYFQTRHRSLARLAGGILAAPVLLIALLLLVLRFTLVKEPPSLTELQHDFASHRSDLDKLIRMFDEDVTFSRIAPTFVDRDVSDPSEMGRYMERDPKAGLLKARWDVYRNLYSRSGIKLGVQRDKAGDAFIMVDSVGLLNRGHVGGYLHCRANAVVMDITFPPCNLHSEKGQRTFNPQPREEAYSFQRIVDGWYAFDEGPS